MKGNEMQNRLAMTVDEAAEKVPCGTRKIREEIAAGNLAARRFGKRILITLEDLNAWLENLPRCAA
jgi:excisionase family DNA binding protein